VRFADLYRVAGSDGEPEQHRRVVVHVSRSVARLVQRGLIVTAWESWARSATDEGHRSSKDKPQPGRHAWITPEGRAVLRLSGKTVQRLGTVTRYGKHSRKPRA
jgi:hypothetical protein